MFGEGAARLCGAAGVLFGWLPDEFWSATPAELALLLAAQAGPAEPPAADLIAQLQQRFPDE